MEQQHVASSSGIRPSSTSTTSIKSPPRLPAPELRPRPLVKPSISITDTPTSAEISTRPSEDDDDDAAEINETKQTAEACSLGELDDPVLKATTGVSSHRSASSLQRLTRAIQSGSTTLPFGLSREEAQLWKAVQDALVQQQSQVPLATSEVQPWVSPLRSPVASSCGGDENVPKNFAAATITPDGRTFSPTSVKLELDPSHQDPFDAREEQDHHPVALRDMQRVLADVTLERDQARAQLIDQNQPDRRSTAPQSSSDGACGERAMRALEAELSRRNVRIRELERELSQKRHFCLTPTKKAPSPTTSPTRLRHGDEARQDDHRVLVKSPQLVDRSHSSSDESATSVVSDEMAQVGKLQGELRDKSSALENAKMIIASLESASGSLAADMRAKLKCKEEELAAVKVDLSEKQRSLDTLATELRDLQRSQCYVRYTRFRDEERSRRLGLSGRLEKNMADFRAALVVLESTTHDPTALDLISNLLSDTILAMKDGIEMLDEDMEADESTSGDASSIASVASSSRGAVPSLDVRRLRKELDEKTRALHRMDEALRRDREEIAQLRAERGDNNKRDEELDILRMEVRNLNEQCYTNMEVLAKKERELAVLRDSLKVDDGVGYISDDGTDATESDVDETPVSPIPRLLTYGPSQAEALATLLLAQGSGCGAGNKNSASTDALNELQGLKQELHQMRSDLERSRKQLKTEKESLVNAKMIISSLEKANKSIMDDLRSRLQDSNTAITSLLEKSIENEKANSKLREEVETMRKEKERYEAEIATLRSSYLDDRPTSHLHGYLDPLEEKKDDKPETID